VQGLSFTSAAIAGALLECKNRGLTVEVLLDASDEQDLGSQLHHLREQGLAPAVDDSHALLRRQAIVIDRKTVIMGSAPLGEPGQAEGAADVLLVMRGHSDLARAWRADLFAHKEHARPQQGAQPAAIRRGPEMGEFSAEDAA
jgi:hypothetical protein